MAIDKTIPNRLQTDIDQRLVRPEAGEMTDAQNVMLSEEGASSTGVIKNMLGTTAATRPALSPIADGEDVVVIGSVSDTQRGFVYWFVADRNEDGLENAIYRQNTGDNSYELVLKNPNLNFDPYGFVKADIVNAAFQQDGVIQTALYFTDNVNPPRKINVDRALNSAVYDSGGFNTVISACKPAMNGYPAVRFSTDEDFKENNFRTELFQFAVQLIYTDGEESAISGYSELAVPRPAIFQTMEESGFGLSPYVDNVCEVTIPIDFQIPDLESVRIIARDGNSGVFFVVDEFDADQDLYRQVFGSSKQIYDASARLYRFYNNSLGRSVSNDTVNKLYDNFPFLAQGQSVIGNRLMYSNYEEGRPNAITNVSFTINYVDDDGSGSNNYIPSKSFSQVISESSTGFYIDIDALPGGTFSDIESPATQGTIIPEGTRIELSFDFGLNFRMGVTSIDADNPIKVNLDGPLGEDLEYVANIHDGTSKQNPDVVFQRKTSDQKARVTYTYTVTNPSGQQLGSAFNSLLSSTPSVDIRYFVSNNTSVYGSPSNPVVVRNLGLMYTAIPDDHEIYLTTQSASFYLDVTWKFPTKNITGSTWEIYPYVSSIGEGQSSLGEIDNTPDPSFSFSSSNPNLINTSIYTGVTNEYDRQAEIVYKTDTQTPSTNITGYVSGRYASASSTPFLKTFKSGSSHTFGIVYYDEFNRSGNVNLLGSVYVEPLASDERSSTERGACTITVDLSNTEPPEWATYYQIVYAGADSYSNYVQYTTGGGYFKHEPDETHEPDHHIENVYVSLSTLSVFNDEKKSSRTYSFSEGDKLRVISRYDNGSRDFESSTNQNSIEFDIVGVEAIDPAVHGDVNNNNFQASSGSDVGKDALILSAPQVNAGVDRFTGYDWFSITGTSPSDLESPVAQNAVNRWGAGTVVEILTPRKHTEERVFYEIGHGGSITSGEFDSTSILLTNGDAYFRPVSCKTPVSEALVGSAAEYVYRTFFLESNTASDGFNSRSWHRGRPHVIFENSATIRRYNGITYSDAYAEDVANLSLSSFNGSLANFFSLESVNGACNYIGTLNDQFLVALQENKMSMVPVNKSILQQSQGGNLAALSTKVLNDPRYYIGDYGCGNNPESVLIRDGQVFFVDASRSTVCRFTSEGISPISDKGVSSLFRDELADFTAQGGTRIVSGYDPRYDHYYVTLRPTGTFNGLTLGYAKGIHQGGAWQSRYTFFPDMYSNQNDMMYSALYRPTADTGLDDPTIFYSHDNQLRNSFYGYDAQPSVVQVVSNNNPSMTKVFNALSLEGDSANWVADPIVTDLNSSAQSLGFVEKEGSYYSFITRDENGTKHITGVGRVASFTASQITFENRVNRNSIPYGSNIMGVSGSGDSYLPLGSFGTDVTFSRFVDPYTIEVEGTINILNETLVGGEVIAVSEATINGDPVRGHWAEITLTNNQTTAFELYCVNTHIARSKQDHAAGQQ